MRSASGLRAAHQAGVIHRDLKPSNVFGEPETGIRLGDFGIAVARSEGTPPESAGTLPFMAPEQLRGGEVGRFTDVWGAGATACDLRYGHAPFESVGEILDERAAAATCLPPTSPAGGVLPGRPSSHAREGRAAAARRRARRRSRTSRCSTKALEPPQPAATPDRSRRTLLLGPTEARRSSSATSRRATADAIVSSANFELKHAHRRRRRAAHARRRRDRGRGDGGRRAAARLVHPTRARDASRRSTSSTPSARGTRCRASDAPSRARSSSPTSTAVTSLAVPALGTGAARVGARDVRERDDDDASLARDARRHAHPRDHRLARLRGEAPRLPGRRRGGPRPRRASVSLGPIDLGFRCRPRSRRPEARRSSTPRIGT